MKISSKNFLRIVLIGGLYTQIISPSEIKEITKISSLQEMTQRVVQEKIEQEQSTLLENIARQELESIPADLQNRFIEEYIESFNNINTLIHDKKLPLYLQLKPNFALDITKMTRIPFIFNDYFSVQKDYNLKIDTTTIPINKVSFSPKDIHIPINFSNLYKAIQIKTNTFDPKTSKQIMLGFYEDISNHELEEVLASTPSDKIIILEILDTKITLIPTSIDRFQSLKILNIEENRKLLEIPEEIGSLIHLKQLAIINNPAIKELPINALIQLFEHELSILRLNKDTLNLIPEDIQNHYFDSITKEDDIVFEIKIKGNNKINSISLYWQEPITHTQKSSMSQPEDFIKEKSDEPYISITQNTHDEETTLTSQIVAENLNAIPLENAISIIQTYVQNLFDKELDRIETIESKIKTSQFNFKNNDLWRAYIEWLIEHDKEIFITVDLFKKGIARQISNNNTYTSTIVINLEAFNVITTQKNRYIKNIFQPTGTEELYDISEYINFIPSINRHEIEYPDNISLFFGRYSSPSSFWNLQASPDQDLTQETLAFYLESLDPEFLEKVSSFTFNVATLFGIPEQIGLLENLEELSIAAKKLINPPENIVLLQHLKKLNLFFLEISFPSITLFNILLDMPHLEEIMVYEIMYESLPDEIKMRFIKTESFQNQSGNHLIRLFLK